jgi:hypothetical protein
MYTLYSRAVSGGPNCLRLRNVGSKKRFLVFSEMPMGQKFRRASLFSGSASIVLPVMMCEQSSNTTDQLIKLEFCGSGQQVPPTSRYLLCRSQWTLAWLAESMEGRVETKPSVYATYSADASQVSHSTPLEI